VSWELHFGPIPSDKPNVLHHCDNRLCVNPVHLWVGTKGSNNRDKAAKGRSWHRSHPEQVKRGEQHPNARITDAQALEIRKRAEDEPYKALAAEFGIHPEAVGRIYRRESWKHLP
jgi:hypothetical protein